MTAMQVIAGRTTNPGGTITALTANTGDSFTVRDFPDTARAYLAGLWAQNATAGVVRVRSANMHDFTQNIRYQSPAALTRNYLGGQPLQPLVSNDALTFEMSGGAAETDSASLLIYYDQLPGIDARLAHWDQIKPRIKHIFVQEVAITGPGTIGDWSAGNALNSAFDLMKADNDYALLGYQSDTACNSIAISGTDTGNLKVGGPGTTESLETRDWFTRLNRLTGLATIPVINSNNRGSTSAFAARNTVGGTITVGFTFALLAK